ncbi:hypothetical protein [Sphingobium sp.]|uniref:hypothetical protein n=1 Tax=Sphingobium sp. TaxID=1912891 RepID=UPI002E23A7C7
MSKDIIGALRVTLGFDTSQFEHGSKRAKETITRDATAIRSQLSGVRAAVVGLGAAFLGSEALQAARRALDYAASLKKTASELGVTTRELQEYRFAAGEAGVAQKDMDAALKTLTKNIGEAKAGTKEQATAFRDMGISVQDANGHVLSAGSVLPVLADKLSKIESPAERAAKGAKFLGESVQAMDALLVKGSKGLQQLRQAAYDTGVVLSDDQIQNADKAAAKLDQVKMVLQTRLAGIVADNANAVNLLAAALDKAASSASWFFQTWKGSERLMRDQGWSAGFFASPARQELAGDPVKYLQMRTGELTRATARRRQLEEEGDGTRAGRLALAVAKKDEQEALRLMRAAQNDPDFQRRWLAERSRNSVTLSANDGALPVPNERPKKGPKDRTEELAQRFRDELAGLYDDQLGLEQDRTTDLRERARIEHERNAAAFDAYNADVDSRVKQGELTAEQARQLKLQRERNHELEKQAINWPLDDALLEEETRTVQASLDREREMLQIRASLATTAKDRRAVQLELLDNELRSVRLSAEEVLARHDSTEAEKALAQAKLDQLEKIRTGETLRINRDTMGPLESYFDSIPKTAAEINEAYENIAANGIRNINDGLAEAAARTVRLKGFAGQLFNQLIADLLRFQMQQAAGGSGGLLGGLFRLGGSLLGLGGNSLGGVSAASMDAINAQADALAVPRSLSFAAGGDMTILGRRGIDRNVLSLNGLPIANVSYGERLSIANDNPERMASIVHVIPSPYFDTVVDQRAAAVATPMAQQAAVAGSSGAQVALARAGGRRFPGA